jgi:hypothetical protein
MEISASDRQPILHERPSRMMTGFHRRRGRDTYGEALGRLALQAPTIEKPNVIPIVSDEP